MNTRFSNHLGAWKPLRFSVWLSLMFWLVGCQTSMFSPTAQATEKPTATAAASRTDQPTITETSTIVATPTSTKTPEPAPTIAATSAPLPTPSKKVLFIYSVLGEHSDFDLSLQDQTWPILVIYTDGQIIMAGNPMREKMMSPKELERFLAKLDKLGFYTIQSNQKDDPSDDLYTMTEKDYEKIYDADEYCIAVYAQKARRLCYYSPFEHFLVPQMKDVLAFLDSYDLPGMSPYSPDRILISVHSGRQVDDTTLQTIPWQEPELSLATLALQNDGVNFVGGSLAKKLYGQYGGYFHIFIENGQEYTVSILSVWPHQELIAPMN